MRALLAGFEPLKIPVFRGVWAANLVSNFGSLIQVVAASWAMAVMTSATSLVALVQTASALPMMLFSLAAGALADNHECRKIMLSAQSFILAMSAALAIISWTGHLTPVLLLGFIFLIGCGVAFNGPAWQASVGEMVPRSSLANAITLNSMGFNLARAAGPAVGGVLVALWGVTPALFVTAVTPLALILVLIRWKSPARARVLPPERMRSAMAAGLQYAATSPGIQSSLIRAGTFGFSVSATLALMPIIARDVIGGASGTYGLLLSAFGIGGVAGGLVGNLVRNRISIENLMRCYFLIGGAAAIVISISHSLLFTGPALVIAGAMWILVLSSLNVTVQLTIPRWVVGRTLALHRMAMFAGLAVGSAVWGWLAQRFDITPILLASAAAYLIGMAIGYFLPLPEPGAFNLDAPRDWQAPDTAVAIEATSGPIEILIRYHIRPTDVGRFLRLMAERKRIRRRDGAQRWTLLRDLGDETIWIERYASPTWTEYVRHNHRRTQADAFVSDGLRELHRGPAPPQIERFMVRQADPSRHRPSMGTIEE